MSISVLIPAYNCSKTIRTTLDSVLAQTVPPDEVIVMDDGSSDNTLDILNSYGAQITVFHQGNRGVASTRNTLVEKAGGDLVAFLDCDDLWHPRYLEFQRRLFEEHPNAAASYAGNVNFFGYGSFDWDTPLVDGRAHAELIDPLDFVKRYNATGAFASMSYCCVPKEVLRWIGSEPFCVSGVDDAYFSNMLPLLGRPIAYIPLRLVAYRITGSSQSDDQLKIYSSLIEVFRLLQERYERQAGKELLTAFRLASAMKKRTYAKLLMGAGKIVEARQLFWLSLQESDSSVSRTKSLTWLLLSMMPCRLQPRWPTTTRPVEGAKR